MRVTHHLFGDESGTYGVDDPVLLGVVRSSAWEVHELALQQICRQNRVYREIKAASTDRNQLSVKREWVDYFFSEPGLEFRCIVKRHEHCGFDHLANNSSGVPPRNMGFNWTYGNLIRHNLSYDERALVFLDARTIPTGDNIYEYLRKEIQPIADAQPLDSKGKRLMQLADLLLGTVSGRLRGKPHPCRTPIEDLVLMHLGRSGFSSRVPGQKFQVWHWTPK